MGPIPARFEKGQDEAMRHFTRLTGGLVAAALVAGSVAPASARGWGPPRHRHHDDTGDVIGTVAAVGLFAVIAAAIASSSANKEAARRADPPPAPRPDDRYDGRPDDGPRSDYDGRAGAPRPDGATIAPGQDEAVDACVLAARDKATVDAGYGEVRGVDQVRPLGNGWDVAGTLVERQSYRGQGRLRDFRCAFQDGRVSAVSLE
jgi:hypothetical protein